MDLNEIIGRIQEYVYPRRPRIKQHFVDYDPLRCGAVSFPRFVRGVSSLGSLVSDDEIEFVAKHFARPNGEIDYVEFCTVIDEVFGPVNLDKNPTLDVPTAGASAGAPTRKPLRSSGEGDDSHISSILRRISLLAKTRGVVMKYCFQDFDRADAATMLVARRSGKVTREVFCRQFPFRTQFSEEDLQVIVKRYLQPDDMVNYQQLHDDVTDDQDDGIQDIVPSTALDPGVSLRWSHEDHTVVERIQARCVERRTQCRDYYHDVDPLRKGYCTTNQVRTVFSILNIPVSEADFETLCKLYCRPEDNMFHYDAFQTRLEEAFTTKGLEMNPLTQAPVLSADSTVATRKNCLKISPAQEQLIAELEDRVRARVQEVWLPIKERMQDFDRTRQGHVTHNQFTRVLTMLNLPISADDVALLALKYADRGSTRDINYKDFCAAVDPPGPNDLAAQHQCSAPFRPNKGSVYFDRNGEVVPVGR